MKNNYIIGSKNEAFGPGSIQNAINDTLVKTKGAVDAKLINKNVSENGVYKAKDDNADGYSSVTVDIPGAGNNAKFDLPSNKQDFTVRDALESIKITSGGRNKRVGSQCFMEYRSLKFVDMRNSGIETISTQAFQDCNSLETIYLPETLRTTSSTNQFYGCTSLKSLELPDTFKKFDGANFVYNCTSLEYIKFNSITPPTAVEKVFANLPTTCKILVPSGTLEAYKAQANFPDPTTYTYEEF